ncbi:hypothetical protein ACIQGZ_20345 [Streptomyces sp. NPDC092296]|uniref:Thoeris anti-defense Tad2 family protein n=1 Tax=Streptomyces sp. NPDC092296 TaxID=3366012 RepID=UPI00382418E7
MADLTWAEVVAKGQADPGLTFARRKWQQAGKYVWVEPPTVIAAPDGRQYPMCATVYFKDVDDVVKPYWPSMDGMVEANDWYEGVSGRPREGS